MIAALYVETDVTEAMIEAATAAYVSSRYGSTSDCTRQGNIDAELRHIAAALAALSLPPPGKGEAIRDQTISDCALAVWKELSGTPAYADAMHLAERAVRALRVSPAKDGWVMVPKEPTPEMQNAAIRAIPMDRYLPSGGGKSKVTLSTDECAEIYRIMVEAALASSQQGEKA